jgi:hypothetical protein
VPVPTRHLWLTCVKAQAAECRAGLVLCDASFATVGRDLQKLNFYWSLRRQKARQRSQPVPHLCPMLCAGVSVLV